MNEMNSFESKLSLSPFSCGILTIELCIEIIEEFYWVHLVFCFSNQKIDAANGVNIWIIR
jgi:hypothetical protein